MRFYQIKELLHLFLGIITRVKRQNKRKVSSYSSDRKLLSKIYKELKTKNTKRMKNLSNEWEIKWNG
jgi:hypothetical protein